MKLICTALLLLTLLVLSGCGRNAVASKSAPQYPQLETRPANFIGEPETTTSTSTNQRHWEVLIAEFGDPDVERLGMKSLFARLAEKNEVIADEVPRSPLVQLARGDSNIVLNLYSGVYSGFCSLETASNLVAVLTQSAGVDLMRVPVLPTIGANEGKVQVLDTQTVFTGASSNSNPATPFATKLSFGNHVRLRVLDESAQTLKIEAAARFDHFGGYQRDDKDRMSQYRIGNPPIFNVTTVGTRAEMQPDEVLLLGSPKQMRVTRTVERVAKLSDIPGIGRLFIKENVETNFFRLLVVIQPLDPPN